MNRRRLIRALGTMPLLGVLPAFAQPEEQPMQTERIKKPDAEWRAELPADRYQVLFREATEPPFSSPLNDEKRAGTFVCAACKAPLFETEHKFDSGTGWPSFTQPIPGSIGTKRDFRLVWPRTEYHCARCGGHQGHVFNDGPRPRGERWCNNGLALEFVPAGDPLPELVD
jgi:peptide-methionine (R)-S-oxide reductase